MITWFIYRQWTTKSEIPHQPVMVILDFRSVLKSHKFCGGLLWYYLLKNWFKSLSMNWLLRLLLQWQLTWISYIHKIRSFVKVYPSIIYAWFWFEYIKWFLRRSSHVSWLAGSSETTLKVHTLRMDKAKFDSNWANLHVWGGIFKIKHFMEKLKIYQNNSLA